MNFIMTTIARKVVSRPNQHLTFFFFYLMVCHNFRQDVLPSFRPPPPPPQYMYSVMSWCIFTYLVFVCLFVCLLF